MKNQKQTHQITNRCMCSRTLPHSSTIHYIQRTGCDKGAGEKGFKPY